MEYDELMKLSNSKLQEAVDMLYKIIPELSAKLKTENEKNNDERKAQLLQEDKNIADELTEKENELQDVLNRISAAETRKSVILSEINDLKDKREAIHKEWVTNFSENRDIQPKPSKSFKIIDIFRKYWGDDLNEYKQFHNLLSNRCSSAYFAGDWWTWNDVISYLKNSCAPKSEIDFLENKHKADNH